jgi:hypothetical protein
MCTGDSKQNDIALTTRAKDYSPSKEKVDDPPPSLVQPSPVTPPTNSPLHLERPSLDTVLRPPQRASFRNWISILMIMLPRTTKLLKIWPKHLLRCQPLKSFKVVHTTEGTVERYRWNRLDGYEFNHFLPGRSHSKVTPSSRIPDPSDIL